MPYKLMKIYVSEDARYKGKLLYHAIVKRLHEIKVAGVTVTRGIEGYGSDNILRTTKILDLSVSLPIIIDIIDTEDKIKEITPIMKEMVSKGVIMTLDVTVI